MSEANADRPPPAEAEMAMALLSSRRPRPSRSPEDDQISRRRQVLHMRLDTLVALGALVLAIPGTILTVRALTESPDDEVRESSSEDGSSERNGGGDPEAAVIGYYRGLQADDCDLMFRYLSRQTWERQEMTQADAIALCEAATGTRAEISDPISAKEISRENGIATVEVTAVVDGVQETKEATVIREGVSWKVEPPR